MRRAWLAAALAVLLVSSGCFTVGWSFPTRPVAGLQIGFTTRNQVRQTFGEPYRVGLEDGQQTWTYLHYRYSAFGPTRTRDLVVRFDESGLVSSYTFNTTEPGDL
jgi:outer membrane protein assembly factor BamE (lipoprotein component of BamABCDE complex)